jgi:hypothetical protein
VPLLDTLLGEGEHGGQLERYPDGKRTFKNHGKEYPIRGNDFNLPEEASDSCFSTNN